MVSLDRTTCGACKSCGKQAGTGGKRRRAEGFDHKNVAVEVFESDSGALTGPDGLEMRLQELKHRSKHEAERTFGVTEWLQ
jgi:ferredoxin